MAALSSLLGLLRFDFSSASISSRVILSAMKFAAHAQNLASPRRDDMHVEM